MQEHGIQKPLVSAQQLVEPRETPASLSEAGRASSRPLAGKTRESSCFHYSTPGNGAGVWHDNKAFRCH